MPRYRELDDERYRYGGDRRRGRAPQGAGRYYDDPRGAPKEHWGGVEEYARPPEMNIRRDEIHEGEWQHEPRAHYGERGREGSEYDRYPGFRQPQPRYPEGRRYPESSDREGRRAEGYGHPEYYHPGGPEAGRRDQRSGPGSGEPYREQHAQRGARQSEEQRHYPGSGTPYDEGEYDVREREYDRPRRDPRESWEHWSEAPKSWMGQDRYDAGTREPYGGRRASSRSEHSFDRDEGTNFYGYEPPTYPRERERNDYWQGSERTGHPGRYHRRRED